MELISVGFSRLPVNTAGHQTGTELMLDSHAPRMVTFPKLGSYFFWLWCVHIMSECRTNMDAKNKLFCILRLNNTLTADSSIWVTRKSKANYIMTIRYTTFVKGSNPQPKVYYNLPWFPCHMMSTCQLLSQIELLFQLTDARLKMGYSTGEIVHNLWCD